MIVAVYLSIYLGMLLFVGGSAWRAYRYATLPVHLRWELYPVPHEQPLRARYGGSYFEQQHWASEPQRRHLVGEWWAVAEEILLLKSLLGSNRRLWLDSFLFHLGIYCEFVAIGLGVVASFAGVGGQCSIACELVAMSGGLLIIAGAFLLLTRRLTEPDLRNSTRPGDLFNLSFFLVTFLILTAGYLLRPDGTASPAELACGVLHFDRSVRLGGAFAAGLMLASALAAYIPFTHMAHYVAKYFTWHSVRWDDRRSEAGGVIETKVSASLAAKPTWSAAHVGADGKRSWAEIATSSSREVRR